MHISSTYRPQNQPLPHGNLSETTSYTFSAKEKDTETSLSYFGARYYTSDLSIWLSVDPMSDKYPHQSNYVYCSDNPIILIDPNGKDEYEFDEMGYYIRTIENKNEDIIHIVNSAGERIASSQKFAYGSVISTPRNNIPSHHSKLPDATMFQVVDGETSRAIFEFFSTNTPVEWCAVDVENKNNDCEYMLGTNHNETSNNIISISQRYGAIVQSCVHNHPNDINAVSGSDHESAIRLEEINPNVQQFNYTTLYGYTRYDKYSPYVGRDGKFYVPLQQITIYGNKK